MKLAEDDLDDDSPEPTNIPARDLNRQVRRLAAAVLVQAVLDSRLQADCHRQDAAQFLYPQSDPAREHLRRMAELAGLSPAWLNECLIRCANLTPLQTSKCLKTRKCLKCKTVLPSSDFALRYDGDAGRYCGRCRATTPVCPGKRRFGKRG
jgi:hypothetical protein